MLYQDVGLPALEEAIELCVGTSLQEIEKELREKFENDKSKGQQALYLVNQGDPWFAKVCNTLKLFWVQSHEVQTLAFSSDCVSPGCCCWSRGPSHP